MKFDFSKLTAPNDALTELRQLIFLKFFDPGNYGALIDFNPSVVQGERLGFVGQFGLMGKAAQGCSPEYGTTLLPGEEKQWDIPEWAIYEKLCWKDVENTLLKYALKNGTNVADLTDSDYMNILLMPKVQEAILNTVHRLIWFGDKNVTAYSSSNASGTLKEGTDAAFFNVTDGLFKRLNEAVAAGKVHRVAVGANDAASLSAQRTAIRKAGVATGILDDLIEESDPILRANGSARIMVTLALADALARDIRQNNKGSDLQWQSLFDGVKTTQYNGVEVIAVPYWDTMIQAYYKGKSGDALLQPYRAIYCAKEELKVASRSADAIAETQVWFDQKDELNYLKARDSVGTLLGQENLITVAW